MTDQTRTIDGLVFVSHAITFPLPEELVRFVDALNEADRVRYREYLDKLIQLVD